MPMQYLSRAENSCTIKPSSIPSPGNNSFVCDFFSSNAPTDKQMTSGFYRQEAGEPLIYTYEYDEMKINVEVHGKFTVSDETGASYSVKPGDIFYFEKGATISFKVEETEDVPSNEAYALNFFCGQRQKDTA